MSKVSGKAHKAAREKKALADALSDEGRLDEAIEGHGAQARMAVLSQ